MIEWPIIVTLIILTVMLVITVNQLQKKVNENINLRAAVIQYQNMNRDLNSLVRNIRDNEKTV